MLFVPRVPAVLIIALGMLFPSLLKGDDRWDQEIKPFLIKHCFECHDGAEAEAEIDLRAMHPASPLAPSEDHWVKLRDVLKGRQMPPPSHAQPEDSEIERVQDWLQQFLLQEAKRRTSDPGPTTLRRLNHREFNYSIRDITQLNSLDLTAEFPIDGAAGEGFTNAAAALAVSPALLDKYMKATQELASHAVLLPNGIRFSSHQTSRDWTNETLQSITAIYAKYVGPDGRLPLLPYFQAQRSLSSNPASQGNASLPQVHLRYLQQMQRTLGDSLETNLFSDLHDYFADSSIEAAGELQSPEWMEQRVKQWQAALWKQQNVGHVKRWHVPVDPLLTEQSIQMAIPSDSPNTPLSNSSWWIELQAVGLDSRQTRVRWISPEIRIPNRPSIPLKQLERMTRELLTIRESLLQSTSQVLRDAARPHIKNAQRDPAIRADDEPLEIARRSWTKFLGLDGAESATIQHYLSDKLPSIGGYEFVQGWGTSETPLISANSSNHDVRVPGNMPAKKVAVHPSPNRTATIVWQAPVQATLQLQGSITHAHPECGNGVVWSLEHRRGKIRKVLAQGISQGGNPVSLPSLVPIHVMPGDVLAIVIGPRDGNHACDLTLIDFDARDTERAALHWNLANDVAADILTSNPHADSQGNPHVWHFLAEPLGGSSEDTIPSGALLDRWLSATELAEKDRLADALQTQLVANAMPASEADQIVYRRLRSLAGPLLASMPDHLLPSPDPGLDLDLVASDSVVFPLAADLYAGCEFFAKGTIDDSNRDHGYAQVMARIASGEVKTHSTRFADPSLPILIHPDGKAVDALRRDLQRIRDLFPAAYCYYQIVPVDEVITLTLFHREDEPLSRLLLTQEEQVQLDELWEELRFVSRDAEASLDAFEQLLEYASQDSDPRLFTPLRPQLEANLELAKAKRLAAEPKHLESLVRLAELAFRRPLTESDQSRILNFYRALRHQNLEHDVAIRLTLARLFLAPEFLYLSTSTSNGTGISLVAEFDMASRMSYLLWASVPDTELMQLASAKQLNQPDQLVKQMHRMLQDPRAKRFAAEFACQWLQIYDFDQLDEKSERHFPEFSRMRGDMYEEAIRYFEHIVKADRSVLELVDSDYTFANPNLAAFYGLANFEGEDWRRIEGVRALGRGGMLAHAAILAKQSGASRTSPILRGNWISEVLLGEKLPRPPPGVPPLPQEESELQGESVRDAIERHSQDPKCMNCHRRIDPLGFALEAYDAIGKLRDKNSTISDTKVRTVDGYEFDGLLGLQTYVGETRRKAFVRQFCKKLLGYCYGRSLQLSDEPILEAMQDSLRDNDYRFSAAMEVVMRSIPFRYCRDRDFPNEP